MKYSSISSEQFHIWLNIPIVFFSDSLAYGLSSYGLKKIIGMSSKESVLHWILGVFVSNTVL